MEGESRTGAPPAADVALVRTTLRMPYETLSMILRRSYRTIPRKSTAPGSVQSDAGATPSEISEIEVQG